MKKLLLLLAVVGVMFTACSEKGTDDDLNNGGNNTEQPGDGNDDGEPSAKDNKIYYTTFDGKKLFPNNTEPAIFGAILVSNTYEDGQGVLTFDDTITSIGHYAFQDCTSLTSVTIPDSVTSIGVYAFGYCPSLTSVYCKPTTPPSGEPSMFAYNVSGRKIYVPRDSVEAYKSAAFWGNYCEDIEGYDF